MNEQKDKTHKKPLPLGEAGWGSKAGWDSDSFIHISDLRLHAFHGVLSQERTVGNDYIINVHVGYPWMHATVSDDVSDTLNYADLACLIKEEMAVPSALLEHVAGRIANRIINAYPETTSVQLKITKVAPPMSADCKGAGVELIINR